MGNLIAFNIKDIKKKFDLNIFIETGTYEGDTLYYLKDMGFDKMLSVEYLKEYYDNALQRFSNINKGSPTYLFHGLSTDKLPEMIKETVESDRILFWLDAHLPSNYTEEKYDNEIEIPLEQELKTIIKHRNICNDYFIIDDLRIYEDGKFTHGNWKKRKEYKTDGIQFIFDLVGDTHEIIRNYTGEGYIILIPKNG